MVQTNVTRFDVDGEFESDPAYNPYTEIIFIGVGTVSYVQFDNSPGFGRGIQLAAGQTLRLFANDVRAERFYIRFNPANADNEMLILTSNVIKNPK